MVTLKLKNTNFIKMDKKIIKSDDTEFEEYKFH